MHIAVLFPTATEARLFQRDDLTAHVSTNVSTHVCGIGLTATAYATLKIIQQHQPDLLILAGIAGAYTHAQLAIGDVVLVQSEIEADLGFFTTQGFMHLSQLPIAMEFERRHTLSCPYLPEGAPFALAKSASLNAAMAPFVRVDNLEIENMEGAAFFHVCLEEKQPFLELRAISNYVKIGADEWDMEGSVRALTQGLHRLIETVTAASRRGAN